MIGQTLGHYRVLEQIGAGGMGLVFRAHDERLSRDVALKLLPPGTLADESARRRFRKEALALSKLNHPNIETVFDFDSQDGVDFLAMELIPGVTLDEKLAAGALPEKEVLRLGMQLAEGLAAAHAEGVIHRDLKPGNLRLTPDGRLKILDFGLAKLLQPIAPDAATESLSQTHGPVGTLPYMAPEQLQGEPAEARSDLWAAGAVLYELATGKRPFPQSSAPMLTDAILRQAMVPPRAVNPNLSPELERILAKALEKDPELRYQSAKELAADLRRLGVSQTVSATSIAAAIPGKRLPPKALVAAGTGALVLLALVAAYLWIGKRPAPAAAPLHIQSLAVLPLANMSGDPQQEYFVDGMTEELTASLAQIHALRVISRTSVMHYKGTSKTVPEIARELNVDAVVEGSVVKAGNRVRITAQLIEAPTDRHLWAESYERDLGDVLAMQDEVSRSIAREVQVTLTPQEQARLTAARPVNPEAHEAYLKGNYYLAKRSFDDTQRAIAYFQQATQADPNYAPGHAALALAYYVFSQYGGSPEEMLPKAKAEAARAVELDDTLAEAHLSLALVKLIGDWDWVGSEAEFKRAEELNPGAALPHYLRGFSYLVPQNRFDEAVAELKRALELDPLSLIINTNLGETYRHARRPDEAIAQCRKTLELDSHFGPVHATLGRSYEQKGMYQEALAEFRLAVAYDPKAVQPLANLGHASAMLGRTAEARKVLAELRERSQRSFVSPWDFATVYVALGEKEKAIASLEDAYQAHSYPVVYLNGDSRFDSLHSEPRFQALVRRIGLRPEDSPAASAVSGAPKTPPAK